MQRNKGRSHKRRGKLMLVLLAACALVLAACGSDAPPSASSKAQQQGDALSGTYTASATSKVSYPLDRMVSGGWLERTLLVENLLRQNDAHRIAYVTLLNVQGQPIAQYTIQGMVFDLNSQLTPPDHIDGGCASNVGCGRVVVHTAGDNGTWGPEPTAVGFFDTNGVEHKWNGLWLESDAPDNITTKPLIVATVDATPSVSAGIVQGQGKGGIDSSKVPPPSASQTPSTGAGG